MMALLSAFAAFAAAPSYKVNPGDYLSIYVWNEESLVREVIIRPDGYISFPLVGEVEAAGQTTGQIELILAEALGKFLKDEPSVTVAPIELRGNKIYVLGKVNRPGEYPINRPTDVMQALALAGGLNTFGAENSINVLRRNADGQQHAIPFRYGDVKDGDELQTNIILQSGDVVVVP
ncbi:MAG: polysaccharide export protein [Gammaproteobacteria bacterium]|nr:polysaccharide export protein [Gammaproteobacteria bacterium]